ncbi:MAG TPA: cyclodeaminase/cyclohydrolase family protein [Candidatus Dormibacteraeota bacterium]|nr:cyclodeaminase/cyclohydrolase family protein [Candidatus Dormibacteraeota bacterium]
MAAPIWESSLEQFRAAAASGDPTPAGVAVSAVSASFALGLLAKVLKVSARHKKFAGSAPKIDSLSDAARTEAKRMLQFAEEDVSAFNAYVASGRLPQASDREREERQRALNAAVRKAIEIPLAAARSAATALELCSEASGLTHAAVIADLGAATSLLSSAMRIFLLCADSNLRQLALDPQPFREMFAARADWELRANRYAESALKHVSSVINSLPGKFGRE